MSTLPKSKFPTLEEQGAYIRAKIKELGIELPVEHMSKGE